MSSENISVDFHDTLSQTAKDSEAKFTYTAAQLEELFQERFARFNLQENLDSNLPNFSQAASANFNSENVPKINHVAFKSPQPLYNQNPVVWFNILEISFGLAGIKSEQVKFAHAVSALDARLHNTFANLIIRDKGPLPYTTFKVEVIKILGESEKARLNNILHNLALDNKKPSQLLNEFRLNAGSTLSDSMLRQLWMKRLPNQIQIILTTIENDLSLTVLAEKADNLMEVLSQNQLGAIKTSPTFSNSQSQNSATNSAGNFSDLEKILEKFKINLLHDVDAKLESHDNRSRSINRQNFRNSSKSRNRLRQGKINPKFDQCFFHFKYGDKARRCQEGCKFFTSKKVDESKSENF